MPAIAFPKSALGAIVDVVLLPSSRHRLSPVGLQHPPAPIQLKMLLDTGAENTSVDSKQIDAAWNLTPRKFYLSQSMGSLNKVAQFDLDLVILHGQQGPGPFWSHDPLLIACRTNDPFNGLPYNGVIGRDVLDRGLLFYDGINGRCTLGY